MKSHSIAVILSSIILISCFTTGLAFADTLWTQNGDNIYNTNSGNVGIGTTAPSANLHVLGNINFSDPVCDISNNFDTIYVNRITTTLSNDSIYGYVRGMRFETTLPQGKQVGDASNKKYIQGLYSIQNVRGNGTHLYGDSYGIFGLSYARENGVIHGNSISVYGQGAIATDGHVTGDLIGVYGDVDTSGGQVDGKRWAGFFHGNTYVSGNVGIGTTLPQSKLAVNGTITAKEVKVLDTGWSDFVFEDNYNLPSLVNVESYIKENKHLPGIPSAKEVEENGLAMSEMLAKQMEKIEELTLYLIELKKENEQMNKNNERLIVELKKENGKLRERISALENIK